MKMLIPISLRMPGGGQCFFPKQLRGKLMNETEAKKVWRDVERIALERSQPKQKRKTA